MKQLIFFLFFSLSTIAQQDSTVKQSFVDSHQYYFLTKEPAKWVIKGYLEDFNNKNENINFDRIGPGLILAFERKISKANSIDISVETRNILTINAELRHYINMKKRIKQGLAANNTSGTYISISAKQSISPYWRIYRSAILDYKDPSFPSRDNFIEAPVESPSVAQFNFGHQQWMADRTILDFSINAGLLRTRTHKENISQLVNEVRNYSGFSPFISSKLKFGLWHNRIKTKATADKCEVLQCFTEETRLLKFNLSDLFFLSKNTQKFNGNIAFEQKLGKLPLSINFDASAFAFQYKRIFSLISNQNLKEPDSKSIFKQINNSGLGYSLMIQPRFYWGQKIRIANGTGVNNLSGMYFSSYFAYDNFNVKGGGYQYNSKSFEIFDKKIVTKNIGLGAGVQSRFNRKGFLDLGFLGGITSEHAFRFSPYLKIGYAIGR